MFNPFTEVIDESTDFDLISQAKNGNRDASKNLFSDIRCGLNTTPCGWLFIRGMPEEVTQEVLIKAITRLRAIRN